MTFARRACGWIGLWSWNGGMWAYVFFPWKQVFLWQSVIGSQVGQIFSISTSEKAHWVKNWRGSTPFERWDQRHAICFGRWSFSVSLTKQCSLGVCAETRSKPFCPLVLLPRSSSGLTSCSPTQKENLEKCHFSELCAANSDMTSAKDCVSWHSLSHCGSVRDDTITRTEDISLRPFEPSNHEIAWNVWGFPISNQQSLKISGLIRSKKNFLGPESFFFFNFSGPKKNFLNQALESFKTTCFWGLNNWYYCAGEPIHTLEILLWLVESSFRPGDP